MMKPTFDEVKDKEEMSTREASVYLKGKGLVRSISTLQNYRSLDKGPSYQKRGFSVSYLRADLDKYVKEETRYIRHDGYAA